MSWGDPQTALNLNTDQHKTLSSLLLTVAGPGRVYLFDPKWQALLHHYNVLVHLDESRNAVVQTATKSMAKHASRNGNLAALSLHCARMLRDLSRAVEAANVELGMHVPRRLDLVRDRSGSDSVVSVGSASVGSYTSLSKPLKDGGVSSGRKKRSRSSFVLIGKGRATCGALNVLKLFVHRMILSGEDVEEKVLQGRGMCGVVSSRVLEQAFLYSEPKSQGNGMVYRDALQELLASLIQFLVTQGDPLPEVYDVAVSALSLLLQMLSPQLYQPFVSSMQREEAGSFANDFSGRNDVNTFFLNRIFSSKPNSVGGNEYQFDSGIDSSKYVLPDHWEEIMVYVILRWFTNRPEAPPRSIAKHSEEILKSLVHHRGETPGPDGLYENFKIVAAEAPQGILERALLSRKSSSESAMRDDLENSSVITAATRSVLSASASLFLIPWKLVRLAISTMGNIGVKGLEYLSAGGNDWQNTKYSERMNEVVWLSESPLADLGSCFLLLVAHNQRFDSPAVTNNFRSAVMSLQDNRWTYSASSSLSTSSFDHINQNVFNDDDNDSIYDPELGGGFGLSPSYSEDVFDASALSINYESLFQALGFTVHNELGSMILYTMMQNAEFSSSLAVRSDLDHIIVPLLRTLYFSSDIEKKNTSTTSSDGNSTNRLKHSISTPFRSPSQLYVVMILLLSFSQDTSFGPDAFRRTIIQNVSWYRERHLRDISLGSLIILCLLRSMTFNLSRLRDGFLLSNTLAVLMNLTPHVTDVHPYAALRLVSVSLNCMRRYLSLGPSKNGDNEEDLLSEQGMYGESCRALLQLLNKCLRSSVIGKNLHVLYALVHRKSEFDLLAAKCPADFVKNDLGERILALISHAHSLLSGKSEIRTAEMAMELLKDSVPALQNIDAGIEEQSNEDFTYLYEEEDDPEVFFVPYIWEIISCVVTPGIIDWEKNRIRIIANTEEDCDGDRSSAPTSYCSSDSSIRDPAFDAV